MDHASPLGGAVADADEALADVQPLIRVGLLGDTGHEAAKCPLHLHM